jgi:serine/threonine-protein phosphatase 2A regulatory subunit B''
VEEGDAADRLLRVVSQPAPMTGGANKGRRAIVPADFMPFLEELLAFHPGLAFLEATPEFQEKYARTVVARIFFHIDPDGTQQINAKQLRRWQPSLLEALHTVDMEEDINAVTDFFSYEHFYVLYCKFWELDDDRDFFLHRKDLSKLQNLTEVCLDRVFAGAGRPPVCTDPARMGYEDFVHFHLAEEDKTSEVSLRYWFRVVDVDGDNVISLSDMQYFYKEQFARMQELGLEAVKVHDLTTQMTDLLCPDEPGRFRLEQFLHPTRIKLTGAFFSALFNITKFQAFEARDPVLVKQELNQQGVSQWDRYAALEYMRLADEEERGAQDDATVGQLANSTADPEDDLVGLMRKAAVN